MDSSLDRIGEWMRLMTKQYGPRDLREACAMPREDAVWFMEHCADAWETQNDNNEKVKETLRQRLEAAEANFQSQRRLSCSCYVVTQEQFAEWNRLQGLP